MIIHLPPPLLPVAFLSVGVCTCVMCEGEKKWKGGGVYDLYMFLLELF